MLPFLQNADRIWSPESGLEMRPRFWFKIDVSRCSPILESEAQIDLTNVVPATTFHKWSARNKSHMRYQILAPKTGPANWAWALVCGLRIRPDSGLQMRSAFCKNGT